ncbi:glycoside hydrolase family 3 protein [Oligoflexus tunisiensis]|uniref:glycoside hydrolase family 3 protein n=1 Tax=Oligoflexus tunisiensis TaxID=708132 RepID=UPI000AA26474|nr:glycoside hydrolase family 3 protein [Oligoflexus tunisiensis]
MFTSKLSRLVSLLILGSATSSLMAATPAEDKQIQTYVSGLSLPAKIGQMIQAEVLDIKKAMDRNEHPISELVLGSVLAGGDSLITPNTSEAWRKELSRFQTEALTSPAGLPLLIGVDAVHGHGLVRGATVFPHNIGLGATRDPELLQKIGSVVAREVLSTGFNWTFAPAVSVARDVRWGRAYESFGERPELQTLLVQPYIQGLQETRVGNHYMAATAKHFLGDGGTIWGTGFPQLTTSKPGIDRGDTRGDMKTLIALHGQGFMEAVEAGVDTIMVSYNSVNGVKMHAERSLITDYLKGSPEAGGLGFKGFVISDWNAIDELPVPDVKDPVQRYQNQLIQAVQAGIDMIMVQGQLELAPSQDDPVYRYARAHQLLLEAVKDGRIAEERINDAVVRILRVKKRLGLAALGADQVPVTIPEGTLGLSSHRQLAREAVRKSLVLLKNEAQTLPIAAAKYQTLCVAGSKADDFGVQVGGWTTGWQGTIGNESKTPGANTILDGLRAAARAKGMTLIYAADGVFKNRACAGKGSLRLVVVGEKPYAEYFGDRDDLTLPAEDRELLKKVQALSGPLAVVLLSGRPMDIAQELDQWQALVAAWLPGSQGEGIADVLFGDYPFTGRLPQAWAGLHPYGFGLQ